MTEHEYSACDAADKILYPMTPYKYGKSTVMALIASTENELSWRPSTTAMHAPLSANARVAKIMRHARASSGDTYVVKKEDAGIERILTKGKVHYR